MTSILHDMRWSFGSRSQIFCASSIVVMFHGLNDSAACCAQGVADTWAKMPGVLVEPRQGRDERCS